MRAQGGRTLPRVGLDLKTFDTGSNSRGSWRDGDAAEGEGERQREQVMQDGRGGLVKEGEGGEEVALSE